MIPRITGWSFDANMLILGPPTDRAMKYTSPPWNIVANGYLVDMKPHMHDGENNFYTSQPYSS